MNWPGHARSHGSAATEGLSLFADARTSTPKTLFNLGETVWAVGRGAPLEISNGRRRFQWVAPDGTIARQSEMKIDGQLDAYRIPLSAQVGAWWVKTVDPANEGYAVATFVVRDPRPGKAAVNLSINLSGPLEVTAGKPLAYTVNVANNGPDEAQNVRFVAEVSSGASFRSLTAARGWTCTKPAANETGLITCTTTSLANGATAAFTVTYQVDDQAADGADITHFADVVSQTGELHEPDNSAIASTIVAAPSCTLDCPQDITRVRDPGKNGAVVNYADPTTSSETCKTPVEVDCNPPSRSFFPAGVTTVTCSSLAGGSCSFKVTVTGTIAITLTGPEKIVLESHTDFTDPGATAQNGSGKIFPATTSGKVNVQRAGTYTITYTATDGAHTASATRQVEVVDSTPPRLNCPESVSFKLSPNTPDQSMAVSFAPTATDNGARTTVTTAPASGSLFPVGVTMVEASVTDAAHNKHSCSFAVSVRYQFTALLRLIGKSSEVNLAPAGSDFLIRFSLSGNKGFNIFAPGYPVSSELACNAAEPAEAQQPIAAEQSNFSYNPSTDQYTYVWKTAAAWAGTCRQLVIKLRDGSEHRAHFKFR